MNGLAFLPDPYDTGITSKQDERENMNTAYKVGQEVISKTEAQGLVKGREYVVVDTFVDHEPWGTFVTYILVESPTQMSGRLYAVRNGHLILSAV